MNNQTSRTEVHPPDREPGLMYVRQNYTEQPPPQEQPNNVEEGLSSQTRQSNDPSFQGVIKKRNREKKKGTNVTWDEQVVDNENLNKKKSKVCCIFHPQRSFEEELEEDKKEEEHPESDNDSSDSDESGDEGDKAKPNAYEHQPPYENQSKLV